MPEEEKEHSEEQKKEPYAEYIEEIQRLKENSVSKDEYQKIKDENRTLLQNLVNGQKPSAEDKAEEQKPLLDLKKETFYNPNITDLGYIKNLLEIRERKIKETGIDPFATATPLSNPSEEDYAKAEKVAKVLQECVNDSNGNNAVFIATLQNRMVDVNIPRRR